MNTGKDGTSWTFASSTMPSPTSSCSLATSASFCSSISAGLRDARFLGGSKLSSWIEGWGLDASWISGEKIVYKPKELIAAAWNLRGKEGQSLHPSLVILMRGGRLKAHLGAFTLTDMLVLVSVKAVGKLGL